MVSAKDVWKDPVWSKVIATAVVAGVAAIFATFQGWWPIIWTFAKRAGNWLCESSSHPNWLLILLWLSLGALLLLVAIIAAANMKGSPDSTSSQWRSYTTDSFFGLQWVWKLGDNGYIYDLFALCLDCKCQVIAREHYGPRLRTEYHCDYCSKGKAAIDGGEYEVEQKVKLRIAKNLRTGEWANSRVA